MKIAAIVFFVMGMAGALSAITVVPEVDPGSAGTAIALLSGALLLIRSRRRK